MHTHVQHSKESRYNSKPLPTPTQLFLTSETHLRNCKTMIFQKMVLAGSKTLFFIKLLFIISYAESVIATCEEK